MLDSDLLLLNLTLSADPSNPPPPFLDIISAATTTTTAATSNLTFTATSQTATTTSAATTADGLASGRGYVTLLAAAMGMLTLTLTAIIANILVIVIFFKHTRLRRCKNVYLVGLSLADLGVGLCMPVDLVDELLWGWAPGGLFCRVYLVLRDSLLVISLLTVLQVSADRWWSIHRPFNYRVRQSKSTATTVLALTWTLTLLVHIPLTGLYDVIAAVVTSSTVPSAETLGRLLRDIGGTSSGSSSSSSSSSYSYSSSSSSSLPVETAVIRGSESGGGGGGGGSHSDPILCAAASKQSEHRGALLASTTTTTTTTQTGVGVGVGVGVGGVVGGGESDVISAVAAAVTCDAPYRNDVISVMVLTVVRFLAPFLFLLVLNVTLYSKIRQRKRVQVRRSISGIDTVLFSLLKASSSDSECNNEENNHLLRTYRAERRLSRLSPAPLNRRHTMSQILFPGVGGGGQSYLPSPSPTLSSSPRQHRPLRRRVSLQDCLQSSGYSSSLQVPRRKSQALGALGLTQSLSDSLLPTSRRQSRDDLAKDMMVKQDKRAACFLGLLQGVLFVCWTPVTVVSIVTATTGSAVLPRWASPCALWLLLANSALNPFLYGLFNTDFSKVVMRWFKIKGSKRDRLKTALRRFSMHIAVEIEKNGYNQAPTFETVVE